ncbi:MAG: ABC transporter permease [Deltaproteobacteria bacterium]|nr:ABC transporter permease [Deltaproteobacteria bacterium]
MNLIELRDIHKIYQLGEVSMPVLQGISLDIAQGDFVALMGASGSGKTTLMNILGCLDRPTSGHYWFDGRDVVELTADERAMLRNQKIGFVFQNFNLLPRTSALDNVLMPLTYAVEHTSDREERELAEALLQRIGLGDRLDHEPSQLSGGQQQRVAIARALVNQPSLLFADEPTGNLDSHTSEEVLRIFQQLNEEEGVTVILVTHDPNVAKHAKRIIRISDGVIEPEREEVQEVLTETEHPPVHASADEPRRSRGGFVIRLRRMLRTALNSLRRNVLRAALTALGIIIGVAAVIAMMEIGRGSSTAIQKSIASMGANNLLVMPGTASTGGVSFGAGSVMTLIPADGEAILNEAPAIKAAAPIVRARTQVVYAGRNWVPSFIYGTTAAYLDVREWPVAEGETFTDRDVRNAGKVCLLGQRVVRELFQGEPPVGKEVRVQNVSFKVIGVLSSKGANMMGMDQDDILLAPWTTIKYRVTGSSLGNVNQSAASSSSSSSGTSQQVNSLSQIYPSVQSSLYPAPSAVQSADTPLPVRFANVDQILTAARYTEEIPTAMRQIKQILRERHRTRAEEPDDFSIRDMTEMATTLSSTAGMMTKLLLAVALISLIVGGVGIMNIMLVSVTERTREIGLRMAVGARGGNILQQFLVESVLLCFCGGIAGILLGRGVSLLVAALLRWPTELSLDAILAAFAVSVTVGIVFGYYPAWKASRLDPIIALRYE